MIAQVLSCSPSVVWCYEAIPFSRSSFGKWMGISHIL